MNIIIFDDRCHLCNRSIAFIQRHDEKKVFTFVSREEGLAQEVMKQHNVFEDSIIYVQDEKVYIYSDAVLEIVKELGGFFRYLYFFKMFPKKLRDIIYTLIARHRYKIFTQDDRCKLCS